MAFIAGVVEGGSNLYPRVDFAVCTTGAASFVICGGRASDAAASVSPLASFCSALESVAVSAASTSSSAAARRMTVEQRHWAVYRARHTICYHPPSHQLIVFGGQGLGSASSGCSDVFVVDVSALPTSHESLSPMARPPTGTASGMGSRSSSWSVTGSSPFAGHRALADAAATPAECSGEPPSPRSGHSCCIHRDDMFVFGGVSSSGRALADFFIFNVATRSWRTVPLSALSGVRPTPRQMAGLAVVTSRGTRHEHDTTENTRRLLVVGGFPARGGQGMSDGYIVSLESLTVARTPCVSPLLGQPAVCRGPLAVHFSDDQGDGMFDADSRDDRNGDAAAGSLQPSGFVPGGRVSIVAFPSLSLHVSLAGSQVVARERVASPLAAGSPAATARSTHVSRALRLTDATDVVVAVVLPSAGEAGVGRSVVFLRDSTREGTLAAAAESDDTQTPARVDDTADVSNDEMVVPSLPKAAFGEIVDIWTVIISFGDVSLAVRCSAVSQRLRMAALDDGLWTDLACRIHSSSNGAVTTSSTADALAAMFPRPRQWIRHLYRVSAALTAPPPATTPPSAAVAAPPRRFHVFSWAGNSDRRTPRVLFVGMNRIATFGLGSDENEPLQLLNVGGCFAAKDAKSALAATPRRVPLLARQVSAPDAAPAAAAATAASRRRSSAVAGDCLLPSSKAASKAIHVVCATIYQAPSSAAACSDRCSARGPPMIAAADAQRIIFVVDAVTGVVATTLKGHSMAVTAMRFGDDGFFLASGSCDLTIRWWDLRDGSGVEVHRVTVTQPAISLWWQPLCARSARDVCSALISVGRAPPNAIREILVHLPPPDAAPSDDVTGVPKPPVVLAAPGSLRDYILDVLWLETTPQSTGRAKVVIVSDMSCRLWDIVVAAPRTADNDAAVPAATTSAAASATLAGTFAPSYTLASRPVYTGRRYDWAPTSAVVVAPDVVAVSMGYGTFLGQVLLLKTDSFATPVASIDCAHGAVFALALIRPGLLAFCVGTLVKGVSVDGIAPGTGPPRFGNGGQTTVAADFSMAGCAAISSADFDVSSFDEATGTFSSRVIATDSAQGNVVVCDLVEVVQKARRGATIKFSLR